MARTLKDIAKKITDLTVLNAPKRTGNLKKQLKKYNTPQRVLGTTKEFPTQKGRVNYGIEFTIDVAPPDAEYGIFVENGTRYQSAQKFAERAINSPEVSIMIDEFVGRVVNESIVKQIEDQLKEFESEY